MSTPMSNDELVAWLNKASAAIYLATDAPVADDISPKLLASATALSSQAAEIRKLGQYADELEDGRDELRAEIAELRKALEPSAATKAAYIGEFKFNVEDRDEDGEECQREVVVPWTTVKQIMKAISAFAALTRKEG